MVANIPKIGLGTWQTEGEACIQAVNTAIEVGYRHIDTADAYHNHKEVGQGIKNSGIKRQELFLTTKVWRDFLKHDQVIASAERFLSELQVDYIDLLLVHWPNKDVNMAETMMAMKELQERKVIRMIGVSNFTVELLAEAVKTGVKILCNQVEFHPSLNQKELKQFCDDQNVLVTAYSPIAQGADLKLPLIKELAEKYGKAPAQICLNWLLSKNMIVVPRSANPERIKENLGAGEFEMSLEDVEKIDNLGHSNRIVHPDFAPF